MDKYIVNSIVVILFLVSSSFAKVDSTSNNSSFGIYAGGGYSVPSGDFAKGWDRGSNFNCGISLFNPSIRWRFSHNRFPLDNDELEIWKNFIQGGRVDIYTFSVDFKADLVPSQNGLVPFFMVDAGFCKVSINNLSLLGTSIEPASGNYFFGGFGGGIEAWIYKTISLFIECRYEGGFKKRGNNFNYIPVIAGISLSSGR